MSKSRHGGKHFMERGKQHKGQKGRPNQQEDGQDWRKTVRQIPEDNG